VTPFPARLELRGAGGEPVDFRRTIASHGVASLPPHSIDEERWTIEATLALPSGSARTVRVAANTSHAEVQLVGGRAGERSAESLIGTTRHILRLDEDLSGFYALAAGDPELSWVTDGAGRMLRSATLFEDVVKTICTTNCAWGGTVRMVTGLVDKLGAEAPGGRHAFPSPAAMAEADERFYREEARAGYRSAYLRSLAMSVADGTTDLGELEDPDLPDEEVAARLLALPGVGPYAAAHIMMTSLGRYSRLILDAWTRPTYMRLAGARGKLADKTIERRFKRYGEYAGLAFWLTLTRGWVV
jgi:3-methyladenine DNA glycosylase/8-oxoguanine DNA glycosylase